MNREIFPDHTLPLDSQIAGHCHGGKKQILGLLKHEDGNILKPIIVGDIRGKREAQFYKDVFSKECEIKELLQLRKFIPVFQGLWETKFKEERICYIRLEDCTSIFTKPSVMDTKIGIITFDPNASIEKRKKEMEKYLYQETLGFRILGMRVYSAIKEDYLIFNNDFGKRQTPETILDGLHTFFNKEKGQRVKQILFQLLNQLHSIQHWFQGQQKLAFYSSSLLLIYDSNHLHDGHATEVHTEEPEKLVSLAKMIDFAHVFPTLEIDENYLFGLKSLINCLTNLLNRIH